MPRILISIACIAVAFCVLPGQKGESPSSEGGMVDSPDSTYSTTAKPGWICKFTPEQGGFLGDSHAGRTIYSKPAALGPVTARAGG